MFVVTGDISDGGRPEEYELAGTTFADLGVPVYCLPGNHDRIDSFHAHLPRPGVVVQSTLRLGGWQFLFADSNAGGMSLDEGQGWIDTPDRTKEAKGGLTDHEFSWLERQLSASSAEHSMLWLHHPPGSAPYFEQPDYDEQVRRLVESYPSLRAVAAGHAHTGVTIEIGGIPSHLCPSTGLSMDFEAMTVMPPGYRTFSFWTDGTVDTSVVWLDDERWNERHQLAPIVAEYLSGRASSDEMQAWLDSMA